VKPGETWVPWKSQKAHRGSAGLSSRSASLPNLGSDATRRLNWASWLQGITQKTPLIGRKKRGHKPPGSLGILFFQLESRIGILQFCETEDGNGQVPIRCLKEFEEDTTPSAVYCHSHDLEMNMFFRVSRAVLTQGF
jgi:hypothetical protein